MATSEEVVADYDKLQAQRQRNILAKTGHTKRGKKQLLKLQDGQCALCKEPIPGTDQVCYDKKTKTVVCRRCMTYLSNHRNARTRGVTEEMTTRYENDLGDDTQKPVRPTSIKKG